MTSNLATPLHIVESYFDIKLDRSALKRFNRVSDEEWIDFAKHYMAAMDRDFVTQFLAVPEEREPPLRLYFEPRMAHEWETAVGRLHEPTPLLGLSPDPGHASEITRGDVSRMLAPLKKHLLVADSVYFRDSFYYCFDAVADSIDRARWREDPNVVNLVNESIRKLKAWLPILIELRGLIESRALVFMPYYMTPSFPYGGDAPELKASMQKLRMRPRADAKPKPRIQIDLDPEHWKQPPMIASTGTQQSGAYFRETEVLGAWLNSRLLGLDPVFPNRAMFDWAADLYFEEGPGPGELVSDLISMDILPFGKSEGISLDDLLKIRKNEDVFEQVRRTVVDCKGYLQKEIGEGSSRQGISDACETFMRKRLASYERKSVLRFIDDHQAAGIAVSVALGAAMIPAAPLVWPIIPVIAGAVLTPQLALLAKRRFDPKRRAISSLQALL